MLLPRKVVIPLIPQNAPTWEIKLKPVCNELLKRYLQEARTTSSTVLAKTYPSVPKNSGSSAILQLARGPRFYSYAHAPE